MIIQHAIWLYFRFPLSFRYGEEMLAERGIEVSYETVRRRVLKFGPAFASNIKSSRPRPSATWHLDKVFVRIGGKRTYLWRAEDDEGEVLEVLAQSRRNKHAALKLMRKLLKKQGYIPDAIVTDKLGSYAAALRDLGLVHLHVTGGRLNYRAEISHPLPAVVYLQTTRGGRHDVGNAVWDGSNHLDRCNDFYPFMMRSITSSTCNDT